MVKRHRLRREQRIRKRREFLRIKQKGKFARGIYLNVWSLGGEVGPESRSGSRPKIGLVVGRKTDPRAAQRNLWKRRIREVFRRNQERIKAGQCILIQAKRQEKVPRYREIESDMKILLRRIEGSR